MCVGEVVDGKQLLDFGGRRVLLGRKYEEKRAEAKRECNSWADERAEEYLFQSGGEEMTLRDSAACAVHCTRCRRALLVCRACLSLARTDQLMNAFVHIHGCV